MTKNNNNSEIYANEQSNVAKVAVFKTNMEAGVNEKGDPAPAKTLVSFGSVSEYTKENGEIEKPNARRVMSEIANINNFLKSVDAEKIPLTIATNDKQTYMTADVYQQSGVSKDGMPYRFNKMAIEIQPEIRNEQGELVQNSQKIYATKGQAGVKGYSFDKNNDPALLEKFNNLINDGIYLNLKAQNNSTLEKYPQLMNALNQVPEKGGARFEVAFVKQQGAVLTENIQILTSDGKEQGAAKLIQEAAKPKKEKSKETER